jgi:hypothetical protein
MIIPLADRKLSAATINQVGSQENAVGDARHVHARTSSGGNCGWSWFLAKRVGGGRRYESESQNHLKEIKVS